MPKAGSLSFQRRPENGWCVSSLRHIAGSTSPPSRKHELRPGGQGRPCRHRFWLTGRFEFAGGRSTCGPAADAGAFMGSSASAGSGLTCRLTLTSTLVRFLFWSGRSVWSLFKAGWRGALHCCSSFTPLGIYQIETHRVPAPVDSRAGCSISSS